MTNTLLLCFSILTPPQDPPTVVDLLVVYTPAARAQAGGTETLQAAIELAVAEANIAYAQSLVPLVLNLVHTREVAYVEDGSVDLQRLTSAQDGPLDEVHPLRDAVGADCVALVTALSAYGYGTAHLMKYPSPSFEPFAFCVVAANSLPLLTLAHELGHIMGCNHDRANAYGNQGAYPFSYGFKRSLGYPSFGTIMSYISSSKRIPYFSNPSVNHKGVPTGISHEVDPANSADNAQTLILTREIVAHFRPTVHSLLALSGGDQILTDKNGDGYEPVILDGSESLAPNVPTPSFEWREGETLLATGPLASVSLPLGTHTLTLTVQDAASPPNISQDAFGVTIVKNQPPIATAGPDTRVVDEDTDGLQSVTLDGTAGFDPDGAILSYTWFLDGIVVGTGAIPTMDLPLGAHLIVLRVEDNGNSGWQEPSASAEDSVLVTIVPPLRVPTVYPTIQSALTAATEGDVILVDEGVYFGPGNRDILVSSFLKNLTIRSAAGPEKTILDCQGTPSTPHRGFLFGSGIDETTVLDGFTIRGAHTGWEMQSGGAIRITQGASPTIRNCILVKNKALFGGGLHIDASCSPKIWNTRILQNSAAVGGGVYTSLAAPHFYNCVIAENTAGWIGGPSVPANTAGGIYSEMSGGWTPWFYHCAIARNKSIVAPAGLHKTGWSTMSTVINSILWANEARSASDPLLAQTNFTTGLLYCDVAQGFAPVLPFTISADPLFDSADHLTPGSPCVDAAIQIFSSLTDLEGTARYDLPLAKNPFGQPGSYSDLGAYEFGGPLSFYTVPSSNVMATVGQSYSALLKAHGGKGDLLQWSISELPPGLSLVTDGRPIAWIQGVPTGPWDARVEFQVRDVTGAAATAAYTLTVKP